MRLTFEDRVGDLVREGEESTYYCMVCTKPKLYVNGNKGTWYCFCCGEGGRLRGDVTGVWVRRSVSTWRPGGLEQLRECPKILEDRGVSTPLLWERLYHKEGLTDAVAFPMTLRGKWVGVQWYNPSKSVRYRVEGERGIFVLGGFGSNCLIFEGFFDLASVYESLLTEGSPTFVCTFGNHLSPEQRDSILELSEKTLHICFDNDKTGPLIKTLAALSFHRETHLLLPPAAYKDWDQALQECPQSISAIEEVL